ncbi:MarR family winged helix-turn-helix transcriptional regulator [Staphylococcus arlettae]|uniref:MarR family winged helix-turn-helix transcriptional regulator n=1 Tax=Staphylococcus arlettae TaxID=29378 RepID=UPI0002822A85|nr:MarR family transcriptional regulator [Staphylococcus arlettae]EJY96473.1 MarR family transcriptional regulator [Staphylococcus arlettae CVD059]MDT3893782.1 MarR family transcriptional regulator [Staphylococcus arlettae]
MDTKNLFNSLTAVYRPYVKLFQPIFERYDLYPAQWLVLKDIGLNAPTTLVQISKRRAIEKPTTRKILKVLSEKNLLFVTQGKDKRERILTLSLQGQSLYDEINNQIESVQEQIVADTGLTADDLATTIKTVTAIHSQLSTLEEE